MKALLLLPLLFLCACTGPYALKAPNHFGIKPSYEIDTVKHYDPLNKYKIEGSLDWDW